MGQETVDNMDQALRIKVRQLIKAGEGCIEHLYLDSVGKVTVGVGNMLPDVTAAQALAFVDRETGDPASEAMIAAEFELLSQQEADHIASYYRQFTGLILEPPTIDQLLDRRINGFLGGLRRNFEGFDTLPDPAQLGLMDMAFNLGSSGLINKFPTFTRAVRAGDWQTCAKECRRRGIQDSRNAEVRELFLSCRA